MNMNFLRNRRALGVAAVTAALLVPLGVFGAPALARSAAASSEYGGSSQYQYKITICHHPGGLHSKKHKQVTISVSANAWKAHQRHGDTMGACQPVTAPTSSTAPSHGNSGSEHGKSGDSHGKGHGK